MWYLPPSLDVVDFPKQHKPNFETEENNILPNPRSPPALRGALSSDGCGWGSFKETMKYCKPHFEARAQFNYGQVNYDIWQNNIIVNYSLHIFSCLHSGGGPVQLVVGKWTSWPWGRSPDVTVWSPEDFCKRTELHETWIRYAMKLWSYEPRRTDWWEENVFKLDPSPSCKLCFCSSGTQDTFLFRFVQNTRYNPPLINTSKHASTAWCTNLLLEIKLGCLRCIFPVLWLLSYPGLDSGSTERQPQTVWHWVSEIIHGIKVKWYSVSTRTRDKSLLTWIGAI